MSLKRRDFLKMLAGLAAPASSFLAARPVFAAKKPAMEKGGATARVVLVSRPKVLSPQGTPHPETLNRMLNDAICRLTGHNTAKEAWDGIFSPRDRVGIKVNALGGRNICTHSDLAYGVAAQLRSIGIPSDNIIIFDRLSRELEKDGYNIQRGGSGIQCYGTDSDYEREPQISGSIGSCFSRILTRKCDAIISLPVLKDHNLAGVSLAMKNFYGVIHNPNKYHDNCCDPFIADLNSHPNIKDKLRLVIIDGLRGQCNGGPGYKPQWAWPFGGLILSRDPVAADFFGTQVLEKKRKAMGLPDLRAAGREPRHIRTAGGMGLGICDPNKIEKILI